MRTDKSTWHETRLRAAVLAGDESAWHVLYESSFHTLYAFVRCRVRDADEAAEIVQETWMVAVRRIRTFDPSRSTFETWLRGVAMNAIRNHRRREQRRSAARLPDAEALGSSTDPLPEHREERAERIERIVRALTLLPARYQSVLRARYRDELPLMSIAKETGSSRKAVESLLARARTAFRSAYARLDEGHEET